MNPKEERFRFFLTGAVVALILFAFVYQLVFIQITQGEAYKRKVTQGYTRTQTVTAARGEIVDRYRRPFATNRISLDIILDQAYLPAGQENQVIYELIQLLESLGQGWTDNLPVSEPVLGADGQYHYSFLPDRESQVARLKSDLHVEAYATADDCMWRLCAPSYYDLGHSTDEEEEKRHPRPWADDPAAQRKRGRLYQRFRRARRPGGQVCHLRDGNRVAGGGGALRHCRRRLCLPGGNRRQLQRRHNGHTAGERDSHRLRRQLHL